jgi:hypothetical protein
MAIFAYTRQQLRHLVARMMNDLIIGTVASPASGSFVCTAAAWEKPDDYFNDWMEVYDYSGTGVGTTGNPTDWVNTTHTLTFLPAATLTANDLVEMHEKFTVADYNSYINMAIEMVAKEALVNKTDTTIELVEATYQYTLPTQFLYIYGIDLESTTADLYDAQKSINPEFWRIINGATTKLEFIYDLFTPIDGRNIRIRGLASPSVLDTDSEECPINPTFVAQQAAALMHQSRIRGSGVDSEWHEAQMKLCQSMANEIRKKMQVAIGGAFAVEA